MRRHVLAVLLALVVLVPARSDAAADPELVPSTDETTPAATTGDSVDDPAIWQHPTDPARSLVIANNKRGALESYDLNGDRVQRITDSVTFWGNVDVRHGVVVAGVEQDVVAVYHRGLQLYGVDPATRLLTRINEGTAIDTAGEGLCLYSSAVTGRLHAIVISISGILQQFEIGDADGDGLLDGRLVREFSIGSEAEGCVADDDTGELYVSEENVALWRYGAEPDAGSTRTVVDTVGGGNLVNDLEGVTLVDLPDGGGEVIVSVQNAADPDNSYFVAYDRQTHELVRTFRITDGSDSDDCDRTDGITALYADLGPGYPHGLFVCQDNNNDAPGSVGNQNLKYVPLELVADLDQDPPPPPPRRAGLHLPVGWSAPTPQAPVPGALVPC